MEGQAKVQWLYCVKSTVLTVVMIVVMEGQAKVQWLYCVKNTVLTLDSGYDSGYGRTS